jgi:hypothetical protein
VLGNRTGEIEDLQKAIALSKNQDSAMMRSVYEQATGRLKQLQP